jgi:adenylate cyclase
MAEEGFKRKLTAILSADAVEYSRLMGEDEEATVRTLTAYREVLTTLIQQHNGKVLDSPGDNLLAEFASVVDAVKCAVSVQKEINARNDELPEDRRMQFRIGINLGDVIEEEERIYGDGVNIAARIETLAEPGGVSISRTVYNQVRSKLKFGYEYQGEHSVKNIAEPVRVYRVLTDPEDAGKIIGEEKPKQWRLAAVSVAVVLVLFAGGLTIWNFFIRPSPPLSDAVSEKKSIAVLPFDNMSNDPEKFAESLRWFEKAIELDPGYSPAYAALAETYIFGSWFGIQRKLGISSRLAIMRGINYLQVAMKNPTNIAYRIAAHVYRYQRQHEKALDYCMKAIALGPNEYRTNSFMAQNLILAGRPDEAVAFAERMRRADPACLW